MSRQSEEYYRRKNAEDFGKDCEELAEFYQENGFIKGTMQIFFGLFLMTMVILGIILLVSGFDGVVYTVKSVFELIGELISVFMEE